MSKFKLLETLSKETKGGETPPVWFMRQAGRYLPEYLEVRKEYSINQIINDPELTVEVTQQPLRRFDFDAGIIFADLLTPLQGMGIKFDFHEGLGPQIENPIRVGSDIENLAKFDPEQAAPATLQAIRLLRADFEKRGLTLIGFGSAPFTLSSYLIEGKSNPKLNLTKQFLFKDPESWQKLQIYLVDALAEYMIAQVEAGAQVLQIFDSWLGGVSTEQYRVYVEPYLQQLIAKIRSKTSVPLIYFATGVGHLFGDFKRLDVECIGIDWRQPLSAAHDQLGEKFVLQGNLDPLLLFGPASLIEKEVQNILQDAKDINSYIFNLGHGILPKTPLESVACVLETIKKYQC